MYITDTVCQDVFYLNINCSAVTPLGCHHTQQISHCFRILGRQSTKLFCLTDISLTWPFTIYYFIWLHSTSTFNFRLTKQILEPFQVRLGLPKMTFRELLRLFVEKNSQFFHSTNSVTALCYNKTSPSDASSYCRFWHKNIEHYLLKESTLTLFPAIYPPAAAKLLVNVPIKMSTSFGSQFQWSTTPRPRGPVAPMLWASSRYKYALYFFFSRITSGRLIIDPSILAQHMQYTATLM